ncbi:MAG: hypothetical protein KKD44_17670 [Proteobacteria bacterium]|nr:hypothetical protein [Pseudomonadota bacterium]
MIKDGYFYFDPHDGIYKDHFPGHPIVPGSIIVQAFVQAIGTYASGGAKLDLSQFRFKHFISPGKYRFSLVPETGRILCRLYDHEKTLVTGTVNL